MPELTDDFGDPLNQSTDEDAPEVVISIGSIRLLEKSVLPPGSTCTRNKYKVNFTVAVDDVLVKNSITGYGRWPRAIKRAIKRSKLMPHVFEGVNFEWGGYDPTPQMIEQSRKVFESLLARCRR